MAPNVYFVPDPGEYESLVASCRLLQRHQAGSAVGRSLGWILEARAHQICGNRTGALKAYAGYLGMGLATVEVQGIVDRAVGCIASLLEQRVCKGELTEVRKWAPEEVALVAHAVREATLGDGSSDKRAFVDHWESSFMWYTQFVAGEPATETLSAGAHDSVSRIPLWARPSAAGSPLPAPKLGLASLLGTGGEPPVGARQLALALVGPRGPPAQIDPSRYVEAYSSVVAHCLHVLRRPRVAARWFIRAIRDPCEEVRTLARVDPALKAAYAEALARCTYK